MKVLLPLLRGGLTWVGNLFLDSCTWSGLVSADKLQELLDKAEGPEALPEERKEMEELKTLLPEIQEKVEDATEGLKSASTAGDAVKDGLVGWECKCCHICTSFLSEQMKMLSAEK